MSVSSLGASWVFSFQSVLPPDFRPFVHLSMEVGQAIDAVTGTRRLNFGALAFLNFLDRNYAVSFSTHPQPMQQH
jgi:hypothetical protein